MLFIVNQILLLYVLPLVIGYLAARICIKHDKDGITDGPGDNMFLVLSLFVPFLNILSCLCLSALALYIYPFGKGLSHEKMKKFFRI